MSNFAALGQWYEHAYGRVKNVTMVYYSGYYGYHEAVNPENLVKIHSQLILVHKPINEQTVTKP